MGGVLLESSNNDKIRVGVGANRNSFVKGDVSASGWEETLGAIDASEVFLRIDRGISSIFESKLERLQYQLRGSCPNVLESAF